MKNRISFSKGFLPCAIFSCIVIASGIFGLATRGINLGIDFKPGAIEEVSIKGAAGIEDVRAALQEIGGASVKKIGPSSSDEYQIRAGVAESEDGKITQALVNKYGEGNVRLKHVKLLGPPVYLFAFGNYALDLALRDNPLPLGLCLGRDCGLGSRHLHHVHFHHLEPN